MKGGFSFWTVDKVARSCEGCHREPLDKYRIPKK
jgi:hypothetical protein